MSEIRVAMPEAYRELDRPHRYKVMYGGRGAARSWTVARKLLLRGVEKPLRVLCTRELQKSIKQSVHKLLKDQVSGMGLDSFYMCNESQLRGANGTEFLFLGVRYNPEEIKSTEGIDICWIEEAENLTETSWDLIDPTIRKAGSEIWVTYNTRFKYDYLHQLFVVNEPPPGSWVRKMTYRDNPYFPDVLRVQMEAMKERDYEKYLHVWGGEYRSLANGSIYREQLTRAKRENRIGTIPIIGASRVYTFWDLGRNDHTAIWFMQNVGKEYRFIDYYENRLKDIDHYCRVIAEKGYLYGDHYMPHDIGQQMLGMSRSRREQFEGGGVKPIVQVERTRNVNEGIERCRDIFASCWFDAARCERGLDALANYRYEMNEENDSFGQRPHHDWSSNGADAFRMFAEGYLDTSIDDAPPMGVHGWDRFASGHGSAGWMQ